GELLLDLVERARVSRLALVVNLRHGRLAGLVVLRHRAVQLAVLVRRRLLFHALGRLLHVATGQLAVLVRGADRRLAVFVEALVWPVEFVALVRRLDLRLAVRKELLVWSVLIALGVDVVLDLDGAVGILLLDRAGAGPGTEQESERHNQQEGSG